MKRLLIFMLLPLLAACSSKEMVNPSVLTSPDGTLVLKFGLAEDGTPLYSLDKGDTAVMLPSEMGFIMRGSLKSEEIVYDGREISEKDAEPDYSMHDCFEIESVSTSSFDETWESVWGEESCIRNNYNEMLVKLKQKESGRELDIRFRLFDDGLGFRYEFPHGSNANHLVIREEVTRFACAQDNEMWWIPGDYDTQEYEYGHCRISEISRNFKAQTRGNASRTMYSTCGVQTSLQMKTPEGLYVNIHEAALVDFPCMHLLIDEKNHSMRTWLTPDAEGNKGNVSTPFKTPWRTVQVAETACAQLESRLVLNLNEPCAYEDVSWIHPVKYVGVWWEMISGCGNWHYTDDPMPIKLGEVDYASSSPNPKHCANNANVKRYIDFAADNGFDAVLVEGWNEGWEEWANCNKDYVFDFITPYPDFDIDSLNNYAHSRGVKLIMHHETSSSVRNYERHMEEAYSLMNKYGYDAVKSGYVGDILPLGFHHYSQWMVNHYLYAVTQAAKHHIMVNAHEAVRPTGLCRTYPNLIGNESAMGTEYQAFGGIKPGHTAILPFTRLNGGPMDYTPGIFEMDLKKQGGGDSYVNSTICGQLALYLTMYSPLQMAADFPENYEKHPDAFQFIKDVAVDWSESRYLFAEPQDYIIVARKAKGSGQWFCGGITDEQERTFSVPLSFLKDGNYTATVYSDTDSTDYLTNPQSYAISRRTVGAKDTLEITMKPAGGFAVSFERISEPVLK